MKNANAFAAIFGGHKGMTEAKTADADDVAALLDAVDLAQDILLSEYFREHADESGNRQARRVVEILNTAAKRVRGKQ